MGGKGWALDYVCVARLWRTVGSAAVDLRDYATPRAARQGRRASCLFYTET